MFHVGSEYHIENIKVMYVVILMPFPQPRFIDNLVWLFQLFVVTSERFKALGVDSRPSSLYENTGVLISP